MPFNLLHSQCTIGVKSDSGGPNSLIIIRINIFHAETLKYSNDNSKLTIKIHCYLLCLPADFIQSTTERDD